MAKFGDRLIQTINEDADGQIDIERVEDLIEIKNKAELAYSRLAPSMPGGGGGSSGVKDILAGTNVTVEEVNGKYTINAVDQGGDPAGSDTQVQFNDGGVFGADANFTWDKTAQQATITGVTDIVGTATDTSIFNIDGSADYTGSSTNYGMFVDRDVNQSSALGTISYGTAFDLDNITPITGTTSIQAGETYSYIGMDFEQRLNAAVDRVYDASGGTYSENIRGLNFGISRRGTHTGTTVDQNFTYDLYGIRANVSNSLSVNAAGQTVDFNVYGMQLQVLATGSVPAGTANKTYYGVQVDMIDSGGAGTLTAYGVDIKSQIYGGGYDTLYGIYNRLNSTDGTTVKNLLANDNIKSYFGTGEDASITYDGTNLVVKPDEVGSGHVQIDGTYGAAIETVTASSDTLDSTNSTVLCDCSSNAITINLPAASGVTGRIYIIKKIDATGNTVTIDPNASETIDGQTTITIINQYVSITVQSNGTNWFII